MRYFMILVCTLWGHGVWGSRQQAGGKSSNTGQAMPANIVVNFDPNKKGIEINGQRYDYDDSYSLKTEFPQIYDIHYGKDKSIKLQLSQDTRSVSTLTSVNSDGVIATTRKDGKTYGINGHHDERYVVFSIIDSQNQDQADAILAIKHFINILDLDRDKRKSAIETITHKIDKSK